MKQKEPKTIEMLNQKERMVYNLCKEDSAALNSNTMLCIKFWQKYSFKDYGELNEFIECIQNYPPESLTRIRRDLVIWGLLTPDKEIQKKRKELADAYKTPGYMQRTEIQWRNGVPVQVIIN